MTDASRMASRPAWFANNFTACHSEALTSPSIRTVKAPPRPATSIAFIYVERKQDCSRMVLIALIELFAAAGVKRFFVWLSPGPDMDVVRGWLKARGLTRVRWTGYPTLCRSGHSPVQFKTDFEIREVSAVEIEAARDQLGDTPWLEYMRTAGKQGFFHYMAFDGNGPVATAALCLFEDLGYLMAARTAETYRKRGAQQALIAKRVERAEQIGCSILVSETLTMLEHSLRNLQRAGFREVYEKEVYEWNA
jgi:GNAT superfamily N-acetyltransferase